MRAQDLHFVEIGEDGAPAEELGVLSQFAVDACAQTVAHYRKAGFSPPWISFFAKCESEIVGICAFTSAPDAARVEIAYHTFPPFEGQGVATAMVRELLTRARQANPEVELFAHTLPEHNASNVILRKLGFEFFGEVTHPEQGAIWEWRRKSS
jgi:RimJ/RimL family protein N-acetyltransferase